MGYFLFLLVTACLLMRPAELIPQLEGQPIYEMFIVPCLLVSLGQVFNQLKLRSLASSPISACIVGLMGAVLISALINYESDEDINCCFDFAKLVVYYLLLVAWVNTPKRLVCFVYYVGVLIFLLTVLSLLRFHNVIDIPVLDAFAEKQWEMVDEETGQTGELLLRLRGAGLFRNPNDLARILVVGMLIYLYGLGYRRSSLVRLLSLVALGVCGYALALTHSRGGFLGLLAGLVVLLWARFGTRKAVALSLVLIPLVLVAFGGRQTQLTTSTGTGHHRVEIWSDYFVEWKEDLLFGIGMNHCPKLLGIVAHNSFVHSYTELGFIGGTFFLGAFYLGVLLPFRAGRSGLVLFAGEFRRFRPYLMGLVAGYMIGMTSSSINYLVTTYMVAGFAGAYMRVAGICLPTRLTRLSPGLVQHVILASGLSVVAVYVFVRISLGG
jgi:hypothetical protein